MMNRMRENTGIILWILVLSFGGLWVLQDSGVFDTIGTDPLGKVIVVDGDAITREQYNRQLEFQLEQIRQSTSQIVEPERVEFERERAFNVLVDDMLRQREMNRLGIAVSNREIQELIVGENPHAVIKTNFAGESGEVDRNLLQSVIDAPEQEGTWIQIEDHIRQDRRRKKFAALIDATVRISDADVDDAWQQEASDASAEFFFLRYADVPDSLVALTDRDLKRYYEEHSDDFLRERVHTIELASLAKQPTQEDTTAILNDVERLRSGFESAEDDSVFLAGVDSEAPWSEAFLGPADLDAALATALFEGGEPLEAGRMVGPLITGETVQLVKVMETREAEEINVRARHILIRAAEGDAEAEAEARTKMREVQQRLARGESFGAIATDISDDPGSGSKEGDLGWFGEGTMVPAFQEAAFGADVGEVVGPVQTQFGLHLIETTARTDVEVRLARIEITLDASVATLTAMTESLEDLGYFGEESGDFAGEAARRNIGVQTMDMEAGQVSIPGFGTSRALAKFLEDAEPGDISPIMEMNEVAIVVHVVSVQKEGTQPLDEVEAIVRPQVLLTKKKAYQRTRMTEAYEADGFDGLAQALGQQPRTIDQISYSDPVIAGLGRDMIFAGTVFGLDEGEDSGVVEGTNAVFVVRTTTLGNPAPLDDDARSTRRSSLLASRKGSVEGQWITHLREESSIEDLRTDLLPLRQ